MTFKKDVTDDVGDDDDVIDDVDIDVGVAVIEASPDGDKGLKDRTAAAMMSSPVGIDADVVTATPGMTNVGVGVVDDIVTFIGRCSTLIGFDLNFISSSKT